MFAGVSVGSCGLRSLCELRVQGLIPLSPACSSLALGGVIILKSASTVISLVTNHELTCGLFKRLDGVIACPEETTNPRLPFGPDQVTLQLLRARYG